MHVSRSRLGPHRLVVALLLACASLTVLTPRPADAAVIDAFTKVFSTNTNGGILLRGNSSMTCPVAVDGCPTARDTVGGGTAALSTLNNNNWDMVNANSDTTTPGVFNSSSSTVSLPTGSTVLFAALVWSGRTAAGTNGSAAVDPTANGTVKLRVPGSSAYTTVTSSRTSTSDAYQGYADVTSLVQNAGSGDYTVANIQSGTGQNQYAGWGLAIAYGDATAPVRNLSLFSGFATVSSGSNSTVDIPVNGFVTPPSGAVRTKVGAVAWEGDAGLTGDQLLLGPDSTHLTNVSDALHASTNVFNSVISTDGVDPGGRVPNNNNNFGVDATTMSANGDLSNGSTSAVVRFTSSSETYYPGLMSFATDLYAPQIDLVKTSQVVKAAGNTQSQLLEPGDTVRYTLSGTNSGTDAASGTVLRDVIPDGSTYVPGSLTVGGTAKSDAGGDDVGSYASGSQTLTVNSGTGATSSTGGTVAIGASIAPVTFQVTVDPVTNTDSLVNTARIDYSGITSGRSVFGASNTLLAIAYEHRSDLGVTMTGDTPLVQRGAGTAVTYHATVSNSGPYDEPAAVLTDALPAGATVVSATPSSGSCATASGTVTCQLGPVASGDSRTVDVVLQLDGAPRQATSTATVSGDDSDVVPANDSAAVTTPVNTAPVAVADSVTTASLAGGGAATFSPAANDTDADPDTLAVTSVSDGSRGSAVLDSDGTVTYTADPGQAGADTLTYTVADGHGGTDTGTIIVTIPNAPPVAHTDDTSTTPLTPVDVDVLANDTDANIPTVDSQSLGVSSFSQPTGDTGTVTIVGNAVRFTPSSTFRTGTTTFGYTVSDGAGGSDTTTVTVTMANAGPVAADDDASTPYDTATDVQVLDDDSDPNGDTLTLTGVSGAAHGTASVVGDHVHYVPDSGWSGTETLTYSISDGHGGTADGQLMITTGDASPTSSDFAVSVPGGGDAPGTAIDVLSHAGDPNGSDVLTVVGAGPASHGTVTVDDDGTVHYLPDPAFRGTDTFDYTVSDGNGGIVTSTVTVTVANQDPTAVDDTGVVAVDGSVDVSALANDSDPNGDALTISGTPTADHGSVTVSDDGTLTYQPDAGFQGSDTISYAVSDGHGGTDTAAVTVTVENTNPVAVADDADDTQAVGSPLTVDVVGNDTDANGDPLHLISAGPDSVHGGTIAVVDGRAVYTPDPLYVGDDTFTYTVGDSRGGVATGTVTVHVTNRSPVAADDTADVPRDTTTPIDVLGNDTDPDGEMLTVSAAGATSAHGGTVAIVGNHLEYTPATGFHGDDTFGYTAGDPRGGTASATVTVRVDAAPAAMHDTAVVSVNGSVTVDVLANDTDPDGDTLAVSGIPTAEHGTVVVHDDGTLTYQPAEGYHGEDTITYAVSDGNGGTDTGTVTVTVDTAPVAVDDAATAAIDTATPITVLGNDSDPDGDVLSLTGATSPAHGTVDIVGNHLRYTPATGYTGTDSFDYTISDGYGRAATATVTVTVTAATPPADSPPVAHHDTATVPPGGSVVIDVLGNDTDANGDALTILGTPTAEHGTVVVNDDGTLTYTPVDGFSGTDTISYAVSDGEGGTDSATVTVTVAADTSSPSATPTSTPTSTPTVTPTPTITPTSTPTVTPTPTPISAATSTPAVVAGTTSTTPTSTSSALPDTGGPRLPLAFLGLGLVLAGAVLLLSRRRT